MPDVIAGPDRRRYRKIFTRLWRNEAFVSMSDDEKVLTLYVLSGPQTNRIGLFRLSLGQTAEDLNASIETIRQRLATVCAAFEWFWDDRAKVVWIPSWWAFNSPGENRKAFQGALSDLNELPHTPLTARFCRNLVDIPKALIPLMEALTSQAVTCEPLSSEGALTPKHPQMSSAIDDRVASDRRSIPARSQEQEQEQEQEIPPSEGSSATLRAAKPTSPALLEFPTVGKGPKTWALTEALCAEWRELYPGLDVLGECRKALAWVNANHPKTARGMPAFLVGWLNRSTNRGGRVASSSAATGTGPSGVPDAKSTPYRDMKWGEPDGSTTEEIRARLGWRP